MRLAGWLALPAAMACAWAQSGPARPFLGEMIDSHGQLRPVYGAGANFHAGAAIAQGVLASACSANLCLAKTDGALVSDSLATPAPPGPAFIAVDAAGATVYFAATSQFARWQHGEWTPLGLTADGTVLALACTSAGLRIAVRRAGAVWVVDPSGAILDSLPSDAAAVLLLPAATVYATPEELVLRRSDASELRFPASGVASLTALGDGYVEAVAGESLYVLRTVRAHEHLFQLPEAGAPPRTRARP